MAAHIDKAPRLARLICVLCACGQILTHTLAISNGHPGVQVDNLMTGVYASDDRSSRSRPLTLCNHHNMISGQEGQLQSGYILSQVHMLMSPGDTSILHNKGQGHISQVASGYQPDPYSTHKMTNFQETVNVYRMFNTERHIFKEFHPDLNFPSSNTHLTDSGFKQVIALGEHMFASYFTDMSQSNFQPKSSQIYVESVPDQHHYQSVLGLLHGLLPEKEFVRVKVHKSPEGFCHTAELQLHEVNAPSAAEGALTSCSCSYLKEFQPHISQALNDGRFMFKNAIPDIEKLRHLFGAYSEYGLSSLQLYKLFRHASCNGLSSVCDTYGQCYNVTTNTVRAIEEMTEKFLHRLSSNPHFRQFSEVTTYPFLQRLSQQINVKSSNFSIYSETNQFLELLKTSLNIQQDYPLPTASRFVFEVYRRAEGQGQHVAGQLFIRLLLNGEDLTSQLDSCHGNLEDGLCPVDKFRGLVSTLQQQYSQKCQKE